MLYYERTDFSEGIDFNKISESKKCDICDYSYFFKNKFNQNVCNRCHDLLMFMNLSDIAILNINGSNYRCIISRISRSKAIKFMNLKL